MVTRVRNFLKRDRPVIAWQVLMWSLAILGLLNFAGSGTWNGFLVTWLCLTIFATAMTRALGDGTTPYAYLAAYLLVTEMAVIYHRFSAADAELARRGAVRTASQSWEHDSGTDTDTGTENR